MSQLRFSAHYCLTLTLTLTLTLPLLLLPATARGKPLLLGGETASMGGTGVASGSDAGMFLLNPAGLARAGSTRITLSASVYGLSRINVPRFFNDGTLAKSKTAGDLYIEGINLTSTAFVGYPSQVSVLFGLGPEPGEPGHMVVGACFVIPDYESRFFLGSAEANNYQWRQGFEWAHEHTEAHFGPSFAMQIGDRLLVGASLFFMSYSYENLVTSPYAYSDDTGTIYYSQDGKIVGQGTSLDFVPVVGAQLKLTSDLAIGLAFTPPSLHITGDFSASGQWREYSNTSKLNSVRISELEGETNTNRPFKATLGASYRRPRSFGAALDFTLIGPREDHGLVETEDTLVTLRPGYKPESSSSSSAIAKGADLTYRISMGGEWFFKPTWVLRAGGFMERLFHPEFEDQPLVDSVLDLRLSHYGGTLGVSNIEGLLETTLGVAVIYGIGTTVGFNFARESLEESFRETDARTLDVLFYLSGGFDLSEIKRALQGSKKL